MSLFHVHEWYEITRTYAPPTDALSLIRVTPGTAETGARILERTLFGVTSILWKCNGCQSFRKDELLGQEPPP